MQCYSNYLFLNELWWLCLSRNLSISSKFLFFFSVFGLTFFFIFSYYFNISRVCSDATSLIPDIVYLCLPLPLKKKNQFGSITFALKSIWMKRIQAILIFNLFLVALDFHCCMWAFTSCTSRGYSSLRCLASHCSDFSYCTT